MMRLFASEMTRLASRRLFQWLLVLFIGVLVLNAAWIFGNDTEGSFGRANMHDGLLRLTFPLLMLGWIIGASSIGAEWGNRTVSALLTWEPRRTRVLVAKLCAAGVSTVLWALALEIVWTALALPIAAGADAPFALPFSWGDYATTGSRILFVSAIAAVFGFSLATIGKNTGAALGGGMAYLLVVETIVRALSFVWSEWLLSSNFVRVMGGSTGLALEDRSSVEAAMLLALYAGGLFLVALWVFRRREMA